MTSILGVNPIFIKSKLFWGEKNKQNRKSIFFKHVCKTNCYYLGMENTITGPKKSIFHLYITR